MVRLLFAVCSQRKIDAAHRLKMLRRDVRSHDLCPRDDDAGVEDSVRAFRWTIIRIRPLTVGHHHRDLSTEMLLVKPKSLLAVPTVVDKRVYLHTTPLSPSQFRFRPRLVESDTLARSYQIPGSNRAWTILADAREPATTFVVDGTENGAYRNVASSPAASDRGRLTGKREVIPR